jgi:hypothetical protein
VVKSRESSRRRETTPSRGSRGFSERTTTGPARIGKFVYVVCQQPNSDNGNAPPNAALYEVVGVYLSVAAANRATEAFMQQNTDPQSEDGSVGAALTEHEADGRLWVHHRDFDIWIQKCEVNKKVYKKAEESGQRSVGEKATDTEAETRTKAEERAKLKETVEKEFDIDIDIDAMADDF